MNETYYFVSQVSAKIPLFLQVLSSCHHHVPELCFVLLRPCDSLALPYIYSITSNRYIVDMVGTPYTSKPNLINAADGTHGTEERITRSMFTVQ